MTIATELYIPITSRGIGTPKPYRISPAIGVMITKKIKSACAITDCIFSFFRRCFLLDSFFIICYPSMFYSLRSAFV